METTINPDEMRHITTAAMDDGKFYTVIWTWRESNRRIISFRRARTVEKRTYREIF
ncbi:MAG: BrnT family toxin [Chlorobiaceae bacterium]|nr:BrnT family toxin [Chlorobiaceae bacterium]